MRGARAPEPDGQARPSLRPTGAATRWTGRLPCTTGANPGPIWCAGALADPARQALASVRRCQHQLTAWVHRQPQSPRTQAATSDSSWPAHPSLVTRQLGRRPAHVQAPGPRAGVPGRRRRTSPATRRSVGGGAPIDRHRPLPGDLGTDDRIIPACTARNLLNKNNAHILDSTGSHGAHGTRPRRRPPHHRPLEHSDLTARRVDGQVARDPGWHRTIEYGVMAGLGGSRPIRRTVSNPGILGGKPIIEDTPLSVEHTLGLLAHACRRSTFIDSHPSIVHRRRQTVSSSTRLSGSPYRLTSSWVNTLHDEASPTRTRFRALPFPKESARNHIGRVTDRVVRY